jgi:hemerythrin-like domain-containing protein
MEALLEREGNDVENWNDDRLDELSSRMDAGFREIKEEMRGGFERIERTMSEGFAQTNERIAQTNERIAQTNERIDRLMLTLLIGTLGIIGTLIGIAVF